MIANITKFFLYATIFVFLIKITTIAFGIVKIKFKYEVDKMPKHRVRRAQDIFLPHRVFIESHRGANTEVFQNTLESFKRAINYGVDSIETDVWLTKDNVLVLLHANSRAGSLMNYYDHPGKVINLTWDELSKYRTIKDNQIMPRLSDLMIMAKDKVFLNLEIKDKRVNLVFPHLIKLIEEYDFFDQIMLGSTFYDYYNQVKEYNKNHTKQLIFGFIYDKFQQNLFDYTKRGNTLNIYWKDATKNVCQKAHENGMAVIAWIDIFEEDNITIYKQSIENGVDSICCNNPKLAINFIKEYYKYSF